MSASDCRTSRSYVAVFALLLLATECVVFSGAQRGPHRRPPPPPPPSASGPPYGSASNQASEKSQCALIIPGLGKSSQFDYFNNNNVPYNGGETCITYDSVNAAFNTARERLRFPTPKGKSLTDQDINNLAEIIVETTRIIAKQYGLPRDAVYNGLPLIDTRKTVIDRFCPSYLKAPKCEVKRFREYNGMCNNLENPHWGATLTSFRRYIPPQYADGFSAPRSGFDGDELPSTRRISAHAHRDMGYHDHAVTVFLISWGQAIDHDMTLAGVVKDSATNEDPKCCDVPPGKAHPNCWPIEIPSKDPFYSLFRRRCMEFIRSSSALKGGCKLGPRSQLNAITSTLDANFVYGSSKEAADQLRTFKGGLLRTLPVFREHGLKDLLPLRLENPDDGCIRPSPDIYCFLAGDPRANEQLVLSVVHIIMLREHNRIATELGQINPHWDDERLYQETRHIMAAIIQHITYNEFLPMVLGKELMQRNELILERDGYSGRYDPKTDPTITDAFTAAAFRFGHSLLPSTVERWNYNHKYVASQRLSEMLLQPYDLYKSGYCDQYMLGLMNQVSQAMDDSVTQEVTNHLFQETDKRWGLDLAAINIQRGRDHGIPSYNTYREHCGLPRAKTWNDLLGSFTNETVRSYSEIYKSVDDIDLWTAGISERPLPGSMVGPTFGCIIAETFRNLRFGDRFWYENSGWPSSFTIDQLNEIRKVKLSRMVCDNSDNIETVQVYVMVLPDHEINPRVPCKSSVLPRIDLSKWRDTEYRPSGGNTDGFLDGPHTQFHQDVFNEPQEPFQPLPAPYVPPPTPSHTPQYHEPVPAPPVKYEPPRPQYYPPPPPPPPQHCCNAPFIPVPAQPYYPVSDYRPSSSKGLKGLLKKFKG